MASEKSAEEMVAWLLGKAEAPLSSSPSHAADAASGVSRLVDLRSDTVTRPTREMRLAMATAEVDDDVLGNDPTSLKLEQTAAALFGKEAGLYLPSGTMSNLIAVITHCDRKGSEVILGGDSHMYIYEQGGIATIGGVHPRTVQNQPDGTMKVEDIRAAVRADNEHYPVTRAVVLENTHNLKGGRVLSVEYTNTVGALCKEKGLALHIDGARIFNALAALQVPASVLCAAADSVSICLSKGLGAPVGSVLVGGKDFIRRARRMRKVLGGGMRQCGIIAAAGYIAITEMPKRLKADHDNARALAAGLAAIQGIKVNMDAVETNMLFVDVTDLCTALKLANGAAGLAGLLEKQGVRAIATGPMAVRFVLHHQVTSDDVQFTVDVMKSIAASPTN